MIVTIGIEVGMPDGDFATSLIRGASVWASANSQFRRGERGVVAKGSLDHVAQPGERHRLRGRPAILAR